MVANEIYFLYFAFIWPLAYTKYILPERPHDDENNAHYKSTLQAGESGGGGGVVLGVESCKNKTRMVISNKAPFHNYCPRNHLFSQRRRKDQYRWMGITFIYFFASFKVYHHSDFP